jgi:fatty acid desaturase
MSTVFSRSIPQSRWHEKPREGLFRHSLADAHCLLYHALALVAYGCAFWVYLHPEAAGIENGWDMTAFILAATFMLGWTSGIDVAVNFHNHAHKPFFRQAWLNRWVGRLWTFSGGWPSYFFTHAHITVHHTHLLGSEDWTLPKRRADGSQEHILVYSFLHWPWRFAYHFWKDFTGGRAGPQGGRKALQELAIFLALWSIPFWIDVRMALLLWVFPQWAGNILLMGAGMYAQHAGCVEISEELPHSHSNTSLSPLLNLAMFNLGYHIEHHEYPTAHWLKLPAVHAAMKQELLDTEGRVFGMGYHEMSGILSNPPPGGGARSTRLVKHRDYLDAGHPFDLGPLHACPNQIPTNATAESAKSAEPSNAIVQGGS